MRIRNSSTTLLLASILAGTGADTLRCQPANDGTVEPKTKTSVKKRIFYFPSDTEQPKEKRNRFMRSKPVWIGAGETVKDPTNPGPFFVDSGGTYSGVGGRHVVIVKKGGKVTAIGGKTLIFYETGADISGASIDPISNTLIAYDVITFEKLEPFTLQGTVIGANGKPAGSVKVHAYDVGKLYLESISTQEDGTFVFHPRREVAYLVADFSPRWTKKATDRFRSLEDLEFRLHVRRLQGWEMAIAEGSWAKDATVKLALTDTPHFRIEPFQELETPSKQMQVFVFAKNNVGLASMDCAGGADISVWDVQTGKLKRRIAGPGRRAIALGYSPDAKVIAVGLLDNTISLWDATTGAKLRDLEAHKNSIMCCAFAPDNKTLASGSADGMLMTWDAATGKLLRSVQAYTGRTTFIAFSPDGKTLLTGGESLSRTGGLVVDHVRLWDAATGKPLCVLPSHGVAGAISPNGKVVASNDYVWRHVILKDRSVSTRDSSIVLASAVTGKELFRLNNVGQSMAFSPDGRIVMVLTDAMTSTNLSRVSYYEVATGQQILSLPLPAGVMKSSWGSGGQLLATASHSSIRIWDLRLSRVLLGIKKDLGPKVLDKLWSDLAAEDAAVAYQAIWTLSAAPSKAVVFLKSHLQPIPVKEVPLERLVADLDSAVFAIRDKASQELKKLDRVAEDYLRQTAKDKKHSLEMQRRLKAILEFLERHPLSREELRQVRAVQVLETIASAEARRSLETLAQGWSAARQTLEARESLQRLKQQ